MSKPSKTATLVLAHGWAFDHQFFMPWLTHSKPVDVEVIALNQAYFQPNKAPHFLRWCPGSETWSPHKESLEHCAPPLIGIGHSLGFSKLLALHLGQGARWHTLVSLCGFTHFLASAGQHAGVHPLVLKRMLRKAGTNLLEVIADFHSQCGAASASSNDSSTPLEENQCSTRLLADLRSMEELNCRGALQTALEQGALLHSITCSEDRIVPADLSAACFQNPALATAPKQLTHHVQEGQHADFMTHPARYTWLIDQLQLAP